MSKKFSILMAAILASMPVASSGSSGIVQTMPFSLPNNVTSGPATFTNVTAGTTGVTIAGYGYMNSAAAAATLSVADDMSSTGWQVDIYVTPSSGSNFFAFVATNLAVTAGAKVFTITSTAQFYSLQGGMLEVRGMTSRRPTVTHSSNGSNEATQGGPVTIANASVNPGPRALTLHAFVVDQISSNVGLTVSASSGGYTNLITNNDGGSGAGAGLCGYILDSTATTDSITDSWGATYNTIAQALLTINLA